MIRVFLVCLIVGAGVWYAEDIGLLTITLHPEVFWNLIHHFRLK